MQLSQQINNIFLSAATTFYMKPLTFLDGKIIDMLLTDSSDKEPKHDIDERQVTTRVIVRGPAQNAYVTVPENSPL